MPCRGYLTKGCAVLTSGVERLPGASEAGVGGQKGPGGGLRGQAGSRRRLGRVRTFLWPDAAARGQRGRRPDGQDCGAWQGRVFAPCAAHRVARSGRCWRASRSPGARASSSTIPWQAVVATVSGTSSSVSALRSASTPSPLRCPISAATTLVRFSGRRHGPSRYRARPIVEGGLPWRQPPAGNCRRAAGRGKAPWRHGRRRVRRCRAGSLQ